MNLTMEKIKCGNNTFDVVEKIPVGFFVWNIGDNMTDGYIPLCEKLYPDANENDLQYYSINTNTLKAIKLSEDEIMILRYAASWGIKSKKTAQKAIRCKRSGYLNQKMRYCAIQTINIFDRITE